VAAGGDPDDADPDAMVARQRSAPFGEKRDEALCDVAEADEEQVKRHHDAEVMAERSGRVPFDCLYRSGSESSAWRAASSSTNSPRGSARTPLSDRLKSTSFSQVDCMRSIAQGSSCMTPSVVRLPSEKGS
jgi:hypothetical protein